MSDNMLTQPFKVAVIDDNAEFGIGVKMLLAKEGVEVHTAADGFEGLELAKQWLPDIVLLDIVMPGMDGIEVCKKIRQIPELMGAYIVMLSGVKIESDQMAEGLEAGADGYIARPISNRELLARLRAFIRLKRNENALEIAEQKYRQIADNVTDVVWITDLELKPTYISPSVERVYGIKPEDFLKLPLSQTYPPASFIKFRETLANELSRDQDPDSDKNRIIQLDVERYYADGSIGWDSISAAFIRDQQGKPIAIQGISRDISERKYAEELLRRSDENLAITLNSIGDGVISTDYKGRIVHMNPIAEKLCGWELTDALGKPLPDVFKILNSITREAVADPVEKVLENGEIMGLANHTVLISKDGTEYQIADSAAPIKNKDGEIAGVVLVFSDVTGKYAVEVALKESQEMMLNSQAVAHICSYSTNLNANEIGESTWKCSPEFYRIFGIDETYPHTIAGWADFIHPDHREELVTYHEYVVKNRIPFSHEYKIIRINDGVERWVHGTGELVYDEQGKPVRMHGAIQDITERKLVEDALHQSEEKFRTYFSESPIGIELYDAEGFQTDANKASLSMFGISDITELKGFNLFDGTSLSSENKEKLYSGESVSYQSTFDFDLVKELKQYHTNRSGKAYFDYLITPMWNSGSKSLLGYMLQVQDISERKRAEQIQNVIYHISNAVVTTENLQQLMSLIQTELGTIIDTSNFYMALYNQQTDTIELPYFVDEYDDFKSIPAEKTLTRLVIQTQKSLLANLDTIYQLENEGVIGRYGADSLIWLGVPLKIEGKVTGVLAVQSYTDANAFNESDKLMLEFISDQISMAIDRKKTEEDLTIAKEKAEESDRLKSAFLANMSHEIRTPMNGILGFAELLKKPDLTGEEQQDYIRIIEKSGTRMLNIINDIVDISKIEAGLMKLDIKESNINEQIEYIYTFFKPEVEAKGMKLTFNTPLPALEATITTDREKVYAILTNLVKNAIKYSKAGTIEVGYNLKTAIAPAELEFYVKDTGIGIPKDRQEAIFERFIQADITDKMAQQGAGLGLSITRAYVEMLGGKIRVESVEGSGSTFYFTLPYSAHPVKEIVVQQSAKSDKNHQIRKLKILIAEDDEISEILLDKTVKMFGKEILKAKTGIEALEVCKRNPDTDLVLIDIRMPEMNGYDVTRKIREFNKEVIIIAQTAYGQSGDREKAIEAGCNDYIAKPIGQKDLIAMIQKYFGK